MKTKHILYIIATIITACGNQEPKELTNLVNYVDSLKHVVDSFQRIGDTTFVANIIDPNGDPEDPFNIRIDTIVEPHTETNYFTGRRFAGISINDHLLEMVSEEFSHKISAIDREKLSISQKSRLKEAEETFERIITEYRN